MEQTDWFDDEAFVNELDKEYTAWKNGSEKGYTLEVIEEAFKSLKSKLYSKN